MVVIVRGLSSSTKMVHSVQVLLQVDSLNNFSMSQGKRVRWIVIALQPPCLLHDECYAGIFAFFFKTSQSVWNTM